ncbi:hypothetical protein HD597_006314 [Nonomuraea thailandensis]|uniref:Uncharacterized protein n=1 Tax=Nonomuraea thailandensis TaxID=1188745 RepID=A0A9X2GHQ5_9ACTN|nr:hypothetical protein [Nonomuraea thailandensis]MCP2359294.1 hypothetical protein [Nonomuraea thailandensis]
MRGAPLPAAAALAFAGQVTGVGVGAGVEGGRMDVEAAPVVILGGPMA